MKAIAVIFFVFINALTMPAQDFLSRLNDTVPNLTFTTISGKTYNTQELKGKIIVLNFWYTHCAPCVAELPEIDQLEKKYRNQNVIVLSLCKDSLEETKQLLLKKGLVLDVVSGTKDIHDLFEIKYYPTSIIIDRSGVIIKSCSTVPYLEKCLVAELDKN